mgnify:CR=1 FL=1
MKNIAHLRNKRNCRIVNLEYGNREGVNTKFTIWHFQYDTLIIQADCLKFYYLHSTKGYGLSFKQTKIFFTQECLLPSLVEIGAEVQLHEKIFK